MRLCRLFSCSPLSGKSQEGRQVTAACSPAQTTDTLPTIEYVIFSMLFLVLVLYCSPFFLLIRVVGIASALDYEGLADIFPVHNLWIKFSDVLDAFCWWLFFLCVRNAAVNVPISSSSLPRPLWMLRSSLTTSSIRASLQSRGGRSLWRFSTRKSLRRTMWRPL